MTLNLFQEYSAHSMKHFNHTQIHRGVCLTTTCKEYVHNHTLQTNEDLRRFLEKCLNESLWRRYELQGELENILYCNREGDIIKYDLSDVLVAVLYLAIIVLNVTGSLYDVVYYRKDDKSGTWIFLLNMYNGHIRMFLVTSCVYRLATSRWLWWCVNDSRRKQCRLYLWCKIYGAPRRGVLDTEYRNRAPKEPTRGPQTRLRNC